VPALVWSACGGAPRATPPAGFAADSADQVMSGMRTYLTNNGVNQAYVSADSAYIYDASGRADLKNIRVQFYSPEGVEQSVLTAREGSYWSRTNQMSARGDVVVVRTSDGARLRTDFLQYDAAKAEVTTDRPWVADKGEQHLEGDGFVCDPSFTNCSAVHGRGIAGRLVMPAQ
jgi:LPS export ABC transporter protein LptC